MNPQTFIPGKPFSLTVGQIRDGYRFFVGGNNNDEGNPLLERLAGYQFFQFSNVTYTGDSRTLPGSGSEFRVEGCTFVIRSLYRSANGTFGVLVDNGAMHTEEVFDETELRERAMHPDAEQYALGLPFGFANPKVVHVPARFLRELTTDNTVFEVDNFVAPSSVFFSEVAKCSSLLGPDNAEGGYDLDTKVLEITPFYSVLPDGWRESESIMWPLADEIRTGMARTRELSRKIESGDYQLRNYPIVVAPEGAAAASAEKMVTVPLMIQGPLLKAAISAEHWPSTLPPRDGLADSATSVDMQWVLFALPVFIPGDGPMSSLVATTLEVMDELQTIGGNSGAIQEKGGFFSWLFHAGATVINAVVGAGAHALGGVLIDGASSIANFLSGGGLYKVSRLRDANGMDWNSFLFTYFDIMLSRAVAGNYAPEVHDQLLSMRALLSEATVSGDGALAYLPQLRYYGVVSNSVTALVGGQPVVNAATMVAFNAWARNQVWLVNAAAISSRIDPSYMSMAPITEQTSGKMRAALPGIAVDYKKTSSNKDHHVAAYEIPVYLMHGHTVVTGSYDISRAAAFHDAGVDGATFSLCDVIDTSQWPLYDADGVNTGEVVDLTALMTTGTWPKFSFRGAPVAVMNSPYDVDDYVVGAGAPFDPTDVMGILGHDTLANGRSAAGFDCCSFDLAFGNGGGSANKICPPYSSVRYAGYTNMPVNWLLSETLFPGIANVQIIWRGHISVHWQPNAPNDVPLSKLGVDQLPAALAASSTQSKFPSHAIRSVMPPPVMTKIARTIPLKKKRLQRMDEAAIFRSRKPKIPKRLKTYDTPHSEKPKKRSQEQLQRVANPAASRKQDHAAGKKKTTSSKSQNKSPPPKGKGARRK